MLCSAAALLSALNALEASMSSTAPVSSDSNIVCVACISAPLPDFCQAHSWSEPLASTTSLLATLIAHFPQILLKTSPNPIGLTAPLPLSSGIRPLTTGGSMVIGSMYCVHRVLVIVAIASHSLVDDMFKGLGSKDSSQAIRDNPRRASCSLCSQGSLPDHLTVDLCIHRFRILVQSIGPKSSEPNLADCGLGCFCCNCDMTSSVKASASPLVVSLRKRFAELIRPSSTSL